MADYRGIHFIVDDKGRKKAVVIGYKAYLELLEDLDDLRVISERRGEPAEDLEKVIADLKSAGRI